MSSHLYLVEREKWHSPVLLFLEKSLKDASLVHVRLVNKSHINPRCFSNCCFSAVSLQRCLLCLLCCLLTSGDLVSYCPPVLPEVSLLIFKISGFNPCCPLKLDKFRNTGFKSQILWELNFPIESPMCEVPGWDLLLSIYACVLFPIFG